ncbi:Plant self-incompatibility S1 [Arabidopsis suecica]|uniref:S-protein homolog n=1 Tax=Arabidopsis suecica TaxID=45249 RepID=A0A8T2F975_ARASU|nr:Plant self-incompatibility S1 [Arabidopsis suecica]
MKYFTIFLIFFSLCMFGHVSGAGIRIVNELKNKKTLWMRCYSKNDVLGPTIIPNGGQFTDYFFHNLFGTTRFMCTLKQGPGFSHSQSFRAFKNFGLWDWRAREDGIYLRRIYKTKFDDGTDNLHKEQSWI